MGAGSAGLQFHLKKHAREAGHTPSVEEMLRSPLPAIPAFKGAQLPDHAETTIPAVRQLTVGTCFPDCLGLLLCAPRCYWSGITIGVARIAGHEISR